MNEKGSILGETQSWYQSRTFWMSIITFGLEIARRNYPEAEWVGLVEVGTGLLVAVFLRLGVLNDIKKQK